MVGRKNVTRCGEKSPFTSFCLCLIAMCNMRGLRAALYVRVGLDMALGKREEAEGYFREGQLPLGPQIL